MGLLSLREAADLAVCPRCHSPLIRGDEFFRCADSSCACAPAGYFPLVDGKPALIDFESSILEKSAIQNSHGASLIPRSSLRGLTSWAKKIFLTSSGVTRRNISVFRDRLAQVSRDPLVVVVGGGVVGNGVETLYDDPALRILGTDVYSSPLIQVIADGHQLPLKDQSVDGVLIQAVLEHVLDPWSVVAEIHRVLKSGGLVYAETPFMQQVHEGAYDFTRFTESGHRYLFKNFQVLSSGPVAGPGTQMLWTIDFLARSLFRSRRAGLLFRALFFWVRFLDAVVSRPYAVDGASGVFFLGRKSGTALTPKEMVAYYQGAQKHT